MSEVISDFGGAGAIVAGYGVSKTVALGTEKRMLGGQRHGQCDGTVAGVLGGIRGQAKYVFLQPLLVGDDVRTHLRWKRLHLYHLVGI